MVDKRVKRLRAKLDKALERRRFDEAADHYRALEQADPDEPRWSHKRGDLLHRLRREEEAVEAYERAVHRYASKGFVARAVAMAKVVLAIDPSRTDVLYLVDAEEARRLHRSARRALEGSGEGADSSAPAAPPQRPSATPASPGSGPWGDTLSTGASSSVPPARGEPGLDDLAPPEPGSERPAPPRAARLAEHASRAPASEPPAAWDGDVAAGPDPAPGASPSLPPSGRSRPLATAAFDDLIPAMDAGVDEIRFTDTDSIDVRLSAREVESVAIPVPVLDVEDLGIEIDVEEPQPVVLPTTDPSALGPEDLALLPGLPLFAEIPREALFELGRRAELVGFDHGEVVFRRGDRADDLYVIVAGGVRLRPAGLPEADAPLLGEGAVFGELCLLDNVPRTADAHVSGHLVALRIERAVLDDLVAAFPRVRDVIFDLLVRRVLTSLLQTSLLFSAFEPTARRRIARLFEARRAPAERVLIASGKRSDGLYVLLSGCVGVRADDGSTAELHPVTVLGQAALVSSGPAALTAWTMRDSIFLRLPVAAFDALVDADPGAAAHLEELARDLGPGPLDAQRIG